MVSDGAVVSLHLSKHKKNKCIKMEENKEEDNDKGDKERKR